MFEHAPTARDRDAGRLGDVGEHETIRSRRHRPMSRPLSGLVRSVAMTLHHDRLRSDRPISSHSHHASTPPARVVADTRAPDHGPVDGAWWPHSDDLSAELDGLETLLAGRAGVLARLTYCMTAWQPIEGADASRTIPSVSTGITTSPSAHSVSAAWTELVAFWWSYRRRPTPYPLGRCSIERRNGRTCSLRRSC